jgi:hypothetical protein
MTDTANANAAACRARLSQLGYEVFDACEMCVSKDVPGGYVLLSGYEPGDPNGEPFVPVDLDAPAFFTLWDEDGGERDGGYMFEHATLRAALDEIEGLCHPRGNPDRAVAGEIGDGQ